MAKPAYFHELFGFEKTDKSAMSASTGDPIPMQVLAEGEFQHMVPTRNDNYFFEAEEVKDIVAAYTMGVPVYIYGHKGCGKTDLIKQFCNRTNRPLVRVNHTADMTEAQIVGQWTIEKGTTSYMLGPLPLAMLNGWVYLADEYDFGMPHVLSGYQAIMEGDPLFIKDAPSEEDPTRLGRTIKPHKNFKMIGTGNTNGAGDVHGRYAGVQVQNSANYDRWGVTIQKQFISEEREAGIINAYTGLHSDQSKKFAEFGRKIRDAYNGGILSDVVSTRALIIAAKHAILRGDPRKGIRAAFTNRLIDTDKVAAEEVAQRIFGAAK